MDNYENLQPEMSISTFLVTCDLRATLTSSGSLKCSKKYLVFASKLPVKWFKLWKKST